MNEVIELKSNIGNFNLESKLDMKIENLPKLSEGIINQEIINDIPNKLKELIPKDFDFKELDQKFYAFIKILFISKREISNKEYMFLLKGLFDVLSDLGVDKKILSRNPKDLLKDIKKEEYDILKEKLEGYCKLRDCKFNYSKWDKLIYILKSIEYFKVKEIGYISEKLLNNLINDYKTFATVDQILGVSKSVEKGVYKIGKNEGVDVNKKKSWKRKAWNKKTYQKTFDLYLNNVNFLINERLISWISEWNKILFSDVSNWKIVFDKIILNLNKHLGLLLFNKASNELILSSHPKIISYINKINKINISDFYAENRSRNVGILYELLLKTGTINVLENKINKFISDSPLLQMLDDVE